MQKFENKTNLLHTMEMDANALASIERATGKPESNQIDSLMPGIDTNHGFEFSEISSTPSYIRLKPLPDNYRDRPVLFLDLDNTLYSKSLGLGTQCMERIGLYFEKYLGIPREESQALGEKYFMDYGLAIRGLIQHFKIDIEQYDRFVDGGLALDGVIRPDVELKRLLQRCKARLWIFTNAGRYHAERVLKLLDIYDQFEGILYCDYLEQNFPSKPERLAYERAMQVAQIESNGQRVYFADDSVTNVASSVAVGWEAVLVDELMDVNVDLAINRRVSDQDLNVPDVKISRRIRHVQELSHVFPELFDE